MIDPYNLSTDIMFMRFFGKVMTKEEIMNDIPCDNANLESLENAKRAYQGDIDMVLEAICQQIDEADIAALFINPTEFGEIMQQKVLDYFDSKLEGE